MCGRYGRRADKQRIVPVWRSPEMRLSWRRSSRAEDRFESWITQQHQRRVLAGETTPSGPLPG